MVESQGIILKCGGQRIHFEQQLTILLVTLNLEMMKWKEQHTSGEIRPSTAWYADQNGDDIVSVYIIIVPFAWFIGSEVSLQTGETISSNDFFNLDKEMLVLQFVNTEGYKSSPHSLHPVVENGTFHVFGGMNQNRMTDLSALDFTTLTWTFLTPGKNQPPPICSHVAVYSLASCSMIVCGSLTSERAENKLWTSSCSQHSWSVMTTVSSPPQPHHFNSKYIQFIPTTLQATSITTFIRQSKLPEFQLLHLQRIQKSHQHRISANKTTVLTRDSPVGGFDVPFIHRRAVDTVPVTRDAASNNPISDPKAGYHVLDVLVLGKGVLTALSRNTCSVPTVLWLKRCTDQKGVLGRSRRSWGGCWECEGRGKSK
ncbi:hypothetical protein BLNAU_5918 [Blattamonas nauphoetae]|uniref:Uncharacterized protein n=1 Tax=Blattamonas nauphoetae TaxID=2049346 RepID=A0ABQ9Y5Y8_9EUKA|nr:hypothetical protein BLNAU_5918 [Blattamonas nauphoetae]